MEQEPSIAPENESVQSLFPDPIYRLFNLDVRQEGENYLLLRFVNVFRLHVYSDTAVIDVESICCTPYFLRSGLLVAIVWSPLFSRRHLVAGV